MLKIHITAALFALSLASQPCLAETRHDTHMKPETVDYALILPANLPHILRTANSHSSRLQAPPVRRASSVVARASSAMKSASWPGLRLPTRPSRPIARAAPSVWRYHSACGDSVTPVSYTHLDVYKRQAAHPVP